MPLYQYECVECDNRQEAEKPVERRRDMESCDKCGAACELVISPVAGFMKGGPTVPSSKRRRR